MLKKVLTGVAALSVSCCALAYQSSPGLYIGVAGGWGNANYGDGYRKLVEALTEVSEDAGNASSKNIDEGGWGTGRACIGYNFLPFFSLEAGFTYFPNDRYRGSGATSDDVAYGVDAVYKTFAADGVVKVILPFGYFSQKLNPFSVFGKAGVAYINSWQAGGYVVDGAPFNDDETRDRFRPTFALGMAYNLSENTSIDFTWTTIIGKNQVSADDLDNKLRKDPVPNCNLYAVGLVYKFPSEIL